MYPKFQEIRRKKNSIKVNLLKVVIKKGRKRNPKNDLPRRIMKRKIRTRKRNLRMINLRKESAVKIRLRKKEKDHQDFHLIVPVQRGRKNINEIVNN